jgi:hypothetical protein
MMLAVRALWDCLNDTTKLLHHEAGNYEWKPLKNSQEIEWKYLLWRWFTEGMRK